MAGTITRDDARSRASMASHNASSVRKVRKTAERDSVFDTLVGLRLQAFES